MAIIEFDTWSRKSETPYETALDAAQSKCSAQSGVWIGASENWQSDIVVFLWHTYVGRCIQDREMNGYNDSDWYMTVYEPETDSFNEILFATTRGWTYPAMGSKPDATPEVIAKWESYQRRLAEKSQAIRETIETMTPDVGKTVEVIKGRKVPKGLVGVVFWVGAGTKYTPNYGYSRHQRVANRLGIKDSQGNTYWTSEDNVQVV
jgi:hypothetical protein